MRDDLAAAPLVVFFQGCGGLVELDLAGGAADDGVCRADIESLQSFFRAARQCPALIVARPGARQPLSLLGLVAALVADQAVDPGASDDAPIAWGEGQPALCSFVEELWEGAVGAAAAAALPRPRSLRALRDHGVLVASEGVAAVAQH